jgi:hypothetical protein
MFGFFASVILHHHDGGKYALLKQAMTNTNITIGNGQV